MFFYLFFGLFLCLFSKAVASPCIDSLHTVIQVGGNSSAIVQVCNSPAPIAISATITTSSGLNYAGLTIWETLGSGNFDDETALSTNYTPSLLDLAIGEVSLVLHPNCTCPLATDTVKIVFLPAVTLGSLTTQAATSCGTCNGKIFLPIQNGVSPFTITYLRVGGGSTTVTLPRNPISGAVVIDNLCPATYRVITLIDANGCPGSGNGVNTNAVIDKPTSPALGANSVQPTAAASCTTCNGFLTIDIIGGTPPFSVQYNSTSGSHSLTGQPLTANHTLILPNFCKDSLRNIIITDANNCTMPVLQGPFLIGQPELPLIGSNGVTTQSASSCVACDGKISIQISATQPGTPPYTVLFDSLGVTKTRTGLYLNPSNQVVLNRLCPNTYTNIRLKDSLDCSIVSPASLAGPFIIEQPNAPKIDTAFVLNQCGATGIVKILLNSVHLGLSPYRIALRNGTTSTVLNNVFVANNEITLSNVTPANYNYIELTDARGCQVVYNRNLQVWSPLTVTLRAQGCQPNGIITATANGIGALSYRWSIGNQNSSVINNLNSGIYTVTVTDNTTFCTISSSLILNPCMSTIQTSVAVHDTVSICLTIGDIAQPITSFSICGQPSNGQVILNGTNPCFQFISNNGFIGDVQFCVVQCNTQGLCDTTLVNTNIYYHIPGTKIILDTVGLGATKVYCLPTNSLPGTIVSAVQIYNNQVNNISFSITGNCLYYTGNLMGSDTATFVVCDNQGFCDTTILYITTFSRPQAQDDILSIENNTTVLISILNNDNCYVGKGIVTLLNGTQDGELVVTLDNKISFRAYPGVCNRNITPIRYRVCNAAGCDTAILYIYVTCKEVKDFEIFNAVSPNGDGLNDLFRIEGIQKYTNNRLQIYNRWGALVYDVAKYNNDWDGSWNDYILPDGTYFYILNLGDGSPTYSGYLELHR